VKGGYWFDKGDNLNDTALEIAMLEYAGKKVIFWTEDQVMYWGIDELIKREPLLNQPYEHGDPIDTDYPPFDYRKYVMTPGRPFRKERMVRRGGRRRPKR
ncbi:MAG: hypothetical protein N3A02_06955, partial [Rectinema sp.]|nr:hypothetical protein [Rectinema sp.]